MPFAFRNIVNDPRWQRPLPYVGFRGVDLLDPAQLHGDRPSMREVVNRFARADVPDSPVATMHVAPVGWIIRNRVLDEIFTEPALAAYPHLLVGNYDSFIEPLELHGRPALEHPHVPGCLEEGRCAESRT